jgi:Uma2 family endonuclease
MDPQTAPPPAAPDPDRVRFYADDAMRYSAQLTWEDLMESTPQATQRKITLESFDVIAAARSEIQCFNELLIQYPVAGQRQAGRVVPDNFVVVHPTPLGPMGSFPVELVPARPLLVMEYVSKENTRKDFEDNMVRYEQALRVPFYLIFYPDNEELTLFRLVGGAYQSVRANEAGRYAVPDLELEVRLLDGWVRFWFRGKLVPLPAELARARDDAERRAAEAECRAAEAARERDAAAARAAALEAELARLRGQPG